MTTHTPSEAGGRLNRLLALRSDRMTLALVAELLAGTEVAIDLADTPDQLLELARGHSPDFVLLNYERPDATGIDICRALRADERLRDVPVVMITARDDRPARDAAMEAGADDFIVKPFDIEDIELRMRAILKANRYRRMIGVQRRFEILAEQAPQGILLVDRRHRLTYVNKAAEQMLGLAAGGTQSWQDAVSARFIRRPDSEWALLGRGGTPSQLLLLDRPGAVPTAPRWFSCQVRQLPDDPERPYMVSISEITGAVRRQGTLWAIKSLVSHKLRTPVNGILAPVELLMAESLTLEQRELVEIIRESSERLANTVAGIEHYFDVPQAAPRKLSTLPEFRAMLPGIASQQGVAAPSLSLLDETIDSVPLTTDSARLILEELFENSRKFHPRKDPHIQVLLSRTALKGLRIDVVDDGRRLNHDQLRKLHLPFYQAEDQATGEVQGEGLGLAQVARVVWEAGGRIQFSNRSDSPGLCVTIEFDQRPQRTPIAQPPTEHPTWQI